MFRSVLKLCIASILAIVVTLSLLIFMRFLLGGNHPEDNYFTQLFSLRTVVLPKENTRPAKPIAVQEQPDTGAFETDNIKQQTEAFLSSQQLEDTAELSPVLDLQPELPTPSLDLEQPAEEEKEEVKDDLAEKRRKLISILEEDSE